MRKPVKSIYIYIYICCLSNKNWPAYDTHSDYEPFSSDSAVALIVWSNDCSVCKRMREDSGERRNGKEMGKAALAADIRWRRTSYWRRRLWRQQWLALRPLPLPHCWLNRRSTPMIIIQKWWWLFAVKQTSLMNIVMFERVRMRLRMQRNWNVT